MIVSGFTIMILVGGALFFAVVAIASAANNNKNYPKIDDRLAQSFYNEREYANYRKARADNSGAGAIFVVGIIAAIVAFLWSAGIIP